MDDIYTQLAHFLDELPGGFPATESGVELQILRKLFTPEEARLALHLTLIPEEARVVAYRAGQPVETVAALLEEMEHKGLIYGMQKPGQPPEYMAQQFVVGFWEGQVNRLDAGLVELFEAYLPELFDTEIWRRAPQLRTIPIGESIPVQAAALPYERAEDLVRAHSAIAVANCICRQEMDVLGQPCEKPMETCLSFGSVAHQYVRTGKGRYIPVDEALEILRTADEAGLVLQPSNAQDPLSLCACCGCCCGVLRSLKRHPEPATVAASPYAARLDAEVCSGCGTCLERCQMGALSLPNGTAELNAAFCIGCGLCVTTCETGALTLERKPAYEQPAVPRDLLATNLKLGQARGKLDKRALVRLLAQSKIDRLKAR